MCCGAVDAGLFPLSGAQGPFFLAAVQLLGDILEQPRLDGLFLNGLCVCALMIDRSNTATVSGVLIFFVRPVVSVHPFSTFGTNQKAGKQVDPMCVVSAYRSRLHQLLNLIELFRRNDGWAIILVATILPLIQRI